MKTSIALALVAAASLAHADPRVDAASAALRAGRCEEAARGFSADIDARGWSVPALVNLGDADACAGRPGLAIVSYERARMLAPRDASLAAKLAAIEASIGQAAPRSYAQSIAALFTERTWTILVIAGAWGLLAALWVAIRRHRPLAALAALACVLVTATSGIALATLDGALRDSIVVARGGSALRVSPFAAAALEAQAPEGARVRPLEHHGDWVRVRATDGSVGWAVATEVAPISN